MKVIGIKEGASYLKSLKSLRTKKGSKRLKEVEKLVDSLMEVAPYTAGGSKIEVIKRNYAKISVKRIKTESKSKIGISGIRGTILLLWNFGLLDVKIIDNFWYVRKTKLASLLEENFKNLDPLNKLKVYLLGGILVDTPARFVYRCTLYGVEDYTGVKREILGYLTSPHSDALIVGLSNMLESIKFIEEAQAHSGKRKYVGLVDIAFYGLSGIYLDVKHEAGKLIVKPNFRELKTLYEIDENAAIGSDYSLGISQEIITNLANVKRRKEIVPKEVQESLVDLIKKNRDNISQDLRTMYGII